MSKADLSLRLLAVLRFTVPSNSSRTLNATQAYDVTSSGITLASAIGKLLDKDAAVKADASAGKEVQTGLTVWDTGAIYGYGQVNKEDAQAWVIPNATAGVWVNGLNTVEVDKKQYANNRQVSTLQFSGTTPFSLLLNPAVSKNSKATNPNTTFYGGIPVGTGDYNKWQGKYAVLKINTITGKGVLRIYDA